MVGAWRPAIIDGAIKKSEYRMKLLIAEDDDFFQKILQQVLGTGHEIIMVNSGDEAWAVLQRADAPQLAILDWVMPGLSGPQVCRNVRACPALSSMYLIILTAKNSEADIVSGLRAGADDYITKPPLPAELQARVRVGERVLELQAALEEQSERAQRGSGPANAASDPLTGCPTNRRVLSQEHFRRIVSCPRQHCEPGDCCSSSEEPNSFEQPLFTTSMENRHPRR
jgi:DNA-binding response OmpR family regulator